MGRSILNVGTSAGADDQLVKIHYHRYDTRHSVSGLTAGVLWRTSHFTTTTPNAVLVVKGQIWGGNSWSDGCGEYVELCNSNGSAVNSAWRNTDGKRYWGCSYAGVDNGSIWAKFLFHWHQVYYNISPGTYEIVCGWSVRDNSTNQRPFRVSNINSNDDSRSRQHESHCEIWELKPGSGDFASSLTNTNISDNSW
tara:strand:+ start:153 stop:737 length:585 start_codon:yes stop_codon:yes gene_type:complete